MMGVFEILDIEKNWKRGLVITIALLIVVLSTITQSNKLENQSRIIYELAAGDQKQVEVYFENLKTGEKKHLHTLTDVYLEHYHGIESYNNALYVIRRISSNQQSSGEWTDQLWKYGKDGKDLRLYSSKGLDFRVSPNGKYITVIDGNSLVFLDNKGKLLKKYNIDKLANDKDTDSSIGLLEWSDDSKYLWGSIYNTANLESFYTIKPQFLWGVKKFDLSNLSVDGEYALNANTGLLLYSDYPKISDLEGRERFKNSNSKVTLFLDDLKNNKTEVIAVSNAEPFVPVWVDEYTFEYDLDSDSGKTREVYKIKN